MLRPRSVKSIGPKSDRKANWGFFCRSNAAFRGLANVGPVTLGDVAGLWGGAVGWGESRVDSTLGVGRIRTNKEHGGGQGG